MTYLFRSALLCALCLLFAARAAQPVADYQFQNTLASTVAGAPALAHLVDATNQQPNTFTTAQVDGVPRTVLHFPQFNGVLLSPTSGLISPGVYTVVVLYSFEEVSGYRRILDFKHGTVDNGVYSYHSRLNFYPVTTASAASLTAEAFHQVVITRSSDGTVAGYVDGQPAISFNDATSQHGVIDANNHLRFFQDNTGGSAAVYESAAGRVARIRVYNVALTAAEVAALDRLPGLGPDRLRVLRILAGLEAATIADIAAWDADGDKALTLADAVAAWRP